MKYPTITLVVLCILGGALRLLVWHWREFYPLGGDEQEYLSTALTILRERRYEELRFMRPPLYPLFLAAVIYLFDSLVQNLRLAQALISTATIPFIYLLASEIGLARSASQASRPWPSALAALLAALSYTLAANATELLSETVFLFGLTVTLWLLVRAGRAGGWRLTLLAGLALGALCLVRSVALPLVPLGALWLLCARHAQAGAGAGARARGAAPVMLLVGAICVVAPWTARNYLTYGGLIVIDTTGAENLWLDNDPAGREAVKAQLYAMGDARLARQQLATQQGLAVIRADPARFVSKAGQELTKLFALEYSDDMRARPAIWLPPAEVAARLVLGDGLWLVVLLAGSYGLGRAMLTSPFSLRNPAFLLAPWALYVVLTALVFHVELRYRLPLYPVLLPYAAFAILGLERAGGRDRAVRTLVALVAPAACLFLMLLHSNYPALAWQLGGKHIALARAEQALVQNDLPTAEAAGRAALANDPRSALARVALARSALLRGDAPSAEALLREAIATLPPHPQAHLLLGDLLRQRGDTSAARAELASETGSLQDLQAWAWDNFSTPPAPSLDLGAGLDMGFVRGFHSVATGEQGFRWTKGVAELRLAAPAASRRLGLRLAGGRPVEETVAVAVLVNGQPMGEITVTPGWHDYSLPLPPTATGSLVVELRSPTFAPRSYDRASPDGRALGVMVDMVEVLP